MKKYLKLFLLNLKNINNYPYIFSPVGFLLVILEIKTTWFPNNFNFVQNKIIFYICLFLGIVFFIYKNWPRQYFTYQIKDTDITIEIKIGNIFNEKEADIIIPINNFFDTTFESGIISKKSIQGQYQIKYWNNNINMLDKIINDELREEKYTLIDKKTKGKNKRYELGTTIKLQSNQNNFFYLTAIAKMNENCVAHITNNEYCEALFKLWNYIYEKGNKDNIAVPILGSGYSRLNMRKEEIIREIIKSFVSSNNEYNFANKLTIVIHDEDIKYINIEEIKEFLIYSCKYRDKLKKQDNNNNNNIGIALEK